MTDQPPSTDQLLFILLGASEWPLHPSLNPDEGRLSEVNPFVASKEGLLRYVYERLGLKPNEQVLDLFDREIGRDDLCERIRSFLEERSQVPAGAVRPSDVVIYYLGQGANHADDEYCLLGRGSPTGGSASAELPVRQLEQAVRDVGRSVRVHLILDACFAAQAAVAFHRTWEGAGVSLLASSGPGAFSRVEAGGAIFTDVLVRILSAPQWKPRALSMRQLGELILGEMPSSTGDDVIQLPRVHSPQQAHGDVSDIPLFPIAPTRRPAETSGKPWCVVLSHAEAVNRTSVMRVAIDAFSDTSRKYIAETTNWWLSPDADYLDALQVLETPDTLLEAIATVCDAELAFFDLTHYEPAVMLLLGIRSAIRRGVTVCCVNGDVVTDTTTVPFHLKEVTQIVLTASEQEEGERKLRRRVRTGIRQLKDALGRYVDLPTFQHVRQLPPEEEHRRIIPCEQRVLMLCPFGPEYERVNLRHVSWRMRRAVRRRLDEQRRADQADAAGDGPPDFTSGGPDDALPHVERILDMDSPRIVSAALLEAIRLTDFCICDLTDWRPNVLFELGVRLAVNELQPICILERSSATSTAVDDQGRDDHGTSVADALEEQKARLARVFGALTYNVADKGESFVPMDDRFQAYYDMVVPRATDQVKQSQAEEDWRHEGQVPPGGVYRTVWDHCALDQEPASRSVVDLLEEAADELLIDHSQGAAPFVFPPQHPLRDRAETNGRECLRAAWLYLHYTFSLPRLLDDPDNLRKYLRLGDRLMALLHEAEHADLVRLIEGGMAAARAASAETGHEA